MTLLIIYLLSLAYCIIKLGKRYTKSTLDGVIGATPNMDIIAMLFLAPILALIDICITIYLFFVNKNTYIRRD